MPLFATTILAAALAQHGQQTQVKPRGYTVDVVYRVSKPQDQSTEHRYTDASRSYAIDFVYRIQEKKPVVLKTREDVASAFEKAPTYAQMTISYHPVVGLESNSMWHIGETFWWIRLHDASGEAMAQLDKSKKYKITGYVLEQNYGVIDVWLKKLEYAD